MDGFVADVATPVSTPAPPRTRVRARVIVLTGLVLLVGAAAYGYDRMSETHYFPGTRIGGQLIGSRSVAEAEAILRRRFVVPLHRPVVVVGPALHTEATPWDMGLRVDVESVARHVMAEQRRTPVFERIWRRAAGIATDAPLRLRFDQHAVRRFADAFVKKVDRMPVDAQLKVTGDSLTIVPDQVGRQISRDEAMEAIERSLARGAKRITLPVHIIPATIQANSFSKVIVISTTSNTLTLYDHEKLVKRFDVATGTGGYPTPLGTFKIVDKQEFPTWYNPHDAWSANMPETIGPGPDNPLGTRAMALNADGILIHGTPEDSSIGTNASHGCIRMHISDAEQLFTMVDVGTPVLIVS
jgi:lipoprotein-anchoring transpeptidase ErfK/SrfK